MSKAENQFWMYLAFEEHLVEAGRSLCTREMVELAKQQGVELQPDSLSKNVITGRLAYIIRTPIESVLYRGRRLYYAADRPVKEVDFSQSIAVVDQTFRRK